MWEALRSGDEEVLARQLGRRPRGVVGVGRRCPCSKPAVVATAPQLPDGRPFPTLYYLTCPRLVAACSGLESSGRMAGMNDRLARDKRLSAAYRQAHEEYLGERERLGSVQAISGISAGGMPTRVKCLHALVAHALAAGRGVNPFGDEALESIGHWWHRPCLEVEANEQGRPRRPEEEP